MQWASFVCDAFLLRFMHDKIVANQCCLENGSFLRYNYIHIILFPVINLTEARIFL